MEKFYSFLAFVLNENCLVTTPVKVKLHYAYKVRNIGRVRPRLRFCELC